MSEVSYAKVVLDGEEYLVKFGFNAIADLEDKYEKPIQKLFDEENIGFTTIRALYWAGLKWKMPGLTLQRVGAMIEKEMEDGRGIKELFEPVADALKRTKMFKKQGQKVEPEAEDEEKNA